MECLNHYDVVLITLALIQTRERAFMQTPRTKVVMT